MPHLESGRQLEGPCLLPTKLPVASPLALLAFKVPLPLATVEPSLELESEEQIRLAARRRLEEQLKQYRVKRHQERVSE